MTSKSESGPAPASMVERMARAMEPELFALEDAARAKGDPLALTCFAWQHAEAVNLAYAKALAALREMREPTEVMAGAARAAPMPMVYVDSISGRLDLAFKTNLRAAIDAEIAAYEAGR